MAVLLITGIIGIFIQSSAARVSVGLGAGGAARVGSALGIGTFPGIAVGTPVGRSSGCIPPAEGPAVLGGSGIGDCKIAAETCKELGSLYWVIASRKITVNRAIAAKIKTFIIKSLPLSEFCFLLFLTVFCFFIIIK